MEKLINKKTMPIIVICCAVLSCVYEATNFIANLENGAAALFTLPSALWGIAAMALIAWGYYKEKENYINLGILLSVSFVASAFPGAFDRIYYSVFLWEDFTILTEGFKAYGISVLFEGLASLCVGVGFVLWVLKVFFNKETMPIITEAIAIAAVVLYLVSLVFLIASNSEYLKQTVASYFSIISSIAYTGIFVCELYRRKA